MDAQRMQKDARDWVEALGLSPGARVTVQGLVKAAEYNGCEGVVLDKQVKGNHHDGHSRVAVLVTRKDGKEKEVSLRTKNVALKPVDLPKQHECAKCGGTDDVRMTCAGCHAVKYCGRACQVGACMSTPPTAAARREASCVGTRCARARACRRGATLWTRATPIHGPARACRPRCPWRLPHRTIRRRLRTGRSTRPSANSFDATRRSTNGGKGARNGARRRSNSPARCVAK